MRNWSKHPEEKLLVGRDWTIDMDGSEIAQTHPPVVPILSELQLQYIVTDGAVVKYWLSGGKSGSVWPVTLKITTTEGEILSDHIEVVVT